MAGDDLNKPLGMGPPARDERRRRLAMIVASCVGLCAVALGFGAVLVVANPGGGEPFAIAALPAPVASDRLAPGADRTATGSIRATDGKGDAANRGGPAGQIENGVTVYRSNRAIERQPGPLVIKVPTALGQSEILPTDKHLIEATRYGPLPRIGADGARPSEVYARPPVFGGSIAPETPRVALLVTGLATDPAATTQAIERLPAAVTLAVSPYGDGLDAVVTRAKAGGHEVLLQLPMDDATRQDGQAAPAPHGLRVGAPQRETLDDLRWLMSRTTGYAGVVDQSGAGFTADAAAMTMVLKEIGGRGLLYIDDGAPRDVGPRLARSLGLAAGHVDVVLDAASGPAAIQAALAKLESIARDKGRAVGALGAVAANLDAAARFAEALDAQGLALVPVSGLMSSAGSPALAAAP